VRVSASVCVHVCICAARGAVHVCMSACVTSFFVSVCLSGLVQLVCAWWVCAWFACAWWVCAWFVRAWFVRVVVSARQCECAVCVGAERFLKMCLSGLV